MQQFVPYLVYRCKQKAYASVSDLSDTQKRSLRRGEERAVSAHSCFLSMFREVSLVFSGAFGNEDSLAELQTPVSPQTAGFVPGSPQGLDVTLKSHGLGSTPSKPRVLS